MNEQADAHATGDIHTEEIADRVSLLQEIPFFKALNPDDLSRIVTYLNPKDFSPGTKILTQDQPVDGVYFLQSGEIQILVSNEQTGQEELITHGYKGECFGEMSTLRGETSASATVLTTCRSRFLFINREEFLRLVDEFNLWPHFVNVLASRLEQTNHRMTEVMKHLKQGMVQVDKSGCVTGKFSMGFVRLIGGEVNEIHGRSFVDLVFSDCPEARKKWYDNYSLAIMSNPDQAELILNLLPEECLFQHPEKGERIFRISYDLCVYQKQVIGVDIGMEDVTRVRELARKSAELEKEKSIITEIYTKPETFRILLELLNNVKNDLAEAENALMAGEVSRENIRNWMGHLHSLKGTSRFLELEELGEAAHRMEDILTEISSGKKAPRESLESFKSAKAEIKAGMDHVSQILVGMGEETRKRLTAEVIFSRNEIDALETLVPRSSKAYRIIQKAKKIPSQKLVEGWKDELERISQALSKKVIFRVMGESVPLPGNVYNIMKAPLVHLLRNCAEHGIETTEQRRKAGKPSVGLITFSAEVTEDAIRLQIQDNGKGIDKEKILRKANQLKEKDKLLRPKIDQLISENRYLAMLFLPGFSTSENVTDLSGRGVGLDVVQRAATEAGGSISMKTVPGKGTKFILAFPKNA